MEPSKLLSGVAGAAAVTGLNYLGQKLTPAAPRLDVLGRKAVRKTASALPGDQPNESTVQATALAGDATINSLYYAAVGLGRSENPLVRGAVAGALMGVAVVAIAPLLGMGRRPVGEGLTGKAMAIGQYTLGGVAAGMAHRVQRSLK